MESDEEVVGEGFKGKFDLLSNHIPAALRPLLDCLLDDWPALRGRLTLPCPVDFDSESMRKDTLRILDECPTVPR